MDSHDLLIARACLKKMFRQSFFSICEVNDACKVLRVPFYGSDAYDRLQALHCTHWADMTPELRAYVVALIKQVIGQEPFDPIPESRGQVTIDVELLSAPVTRPGFFNKAKRLLGFA